jgi:hypothetical protein
MYMSKHRGRIGLSVALGVVALIALVAPVRSQAQGQSQAYRAPRAGDGHPDLNGVWQAVNTANYDLEPHVARHAMALRPGPHGPLPAKEVLYLGAVGAVPGGTGSVEGGVIPYKPEALKIRNENREKWLERDPEIRCYLPGIPRATYMPYPFQIFQNRSAFAIAYEYAGAVRNIYLKDPGPPASDTWMGQSVGRWESETFVVETTGFNGMAWLDRSGNFTSANLKVTERFTRTAPDHLQYEATIDDAETFSMPLYRRIESDAQLMEFKCVEFVEELLFGQWRKNPLPR